MHTINTNVVRGRSYEKIFYMKFIIQKFLYVKISISTVYASASNEHVQSEMETTPLKCSSPMRKLKCDGHIIYIHTYYIQSESATELDVSR